MPDVSVTILHFDDEVSTVSNIPDTLFHLYSEQRSNWVNDAECEYDGYVKKFIIRSPGGTLRVEYVLTSEIDDCRTRLKRLNPASDIAIFDLMREDPHNGTINAVGKSLYLEAIKKTFGRDRVFILSGFPNIIAEQFTPAEFAVNQLLQKPISAVLMSERLVQLFPPFVQLAPEGTP